MKILQNNFVVNHTNKNCISEKITFYKTNATQAAAIATAAIIIFMQGIVSVNTAKTSSHILPDTETTTPTATWAKTFNDISKNLLIVQQSLKKPMQPRYSSTETALKASLILNPSHLLNTIEILTQPKARSVETAALSRAKDDCKSLTAAWGDVDPNIFFICDKQTKKSLQLRCPAGKGFFRGLGFAGCIPFEQWPACISSGHHEQVTLCDSEHMQQPWEYMNPNKFYVCLKEDIKPTILNCETGKGFVHANVTTSAASGGIDTRDGGVGASIFTEIVGCANWEKWRNYMHCNNYY